MHRLCSSALLFGLLCGCGGGAGGGLREVNGDITFKGAPLEHGTIQFQPTDAKGNAAGAVIEKGKYSIPREKGLKPATYMVIISSAKGTDVDPNVPPGESGPVAKELIPPEWNANSKKTVEVKDSGTNTFDFTIP